MIGKLDQPDQMLAMNGIGQAWGEWGACMVVTMSLILLSRDSGVDSKA